jgi:DDE family transposase
MPRQAHHTLSAALPQADCRASDLWTTEIVPHLPADLEAQARILGAFQRRRALASATDLLRALLAAVLLTTSLQQLGAWAVLADVADISAPAWHKRLLRSSAWLLWLLAELLSAPPAPCRLIPHTTGNLLLVDATRLGQEGGSGDDWRLHTAYNFTLGRLVQVTVTDQTGGEHLGYYRIQPGDIVVADNGYGYRRSVATVRKQQGHLVIRIRPSTFPFEQADGALVDVVAQLHKRGPSVREWAGWCTTADGERYRVRLIAAKLPPREAAAARRRARQNATKHGRTVQASTLEVAGWVLLITTVPAPRWDAAAVLQLYRVRWQIELVYKRMKSILRLGRLRGRTRGSVEASIRALLVAWAVQEREAAWVRQHLAQLAAAPTGIPSSWTLTALSVDTLRQQVRGGWGQARVHSCLPRLCRFLTSRVRSDREHQETVVRAWLERRPQPVLGLWQDRE